MSRCPVDLLSTPTDNRLRGSWGRIEVHLSGLSELSIPFVTLRTGQGEQLGPNIYLRRRKVSDKKPGQIFYAISFVPDDAETIRLSALGPTASAIQARLRHVDYSI